MKTKLIFIIIAVIVLLVVIAVTCVVYKMNDNNIDTNIDLSNVPPALNPETKEFIIKAGVNTPGLEGNDDFFFPRGLKYLTKKSTYTNIKEKGFDHIRVPIDFRLFYNEETNTLDEELIKNYDKILDLAEWAGLYVIIDFHGWYDISSLKTDLNLFVNIWKLVAERYKDRSNYVIFELVNEPSGNTAPPGGLNRLQKKAIEAIRESNPDRLILCAAPDGNQPWQLGELSIPENDNNLAVAVHIYHPGEFTHQGYEWAGREKDKQVRLTDKHLEELNWNLNETKKFIDETGIPVIINEFGMNLEISDNNDRYTYLGIITQFCRENNIPWTFWRYDWEQMGLYDQGKWKEDILDVLFGRN